MDSPTSSGTELDVVDTCEMLVAVEEATLRAGMASLLVTAETPTETMSLESRADSLAARLGDVVEIGFSSVGGCVGAVFPVGFVGILAMGNSAPLAEASGIEVLMMRSVSIVVAVAVVDLAESVHISVSEGGTVLGEGFNLGTEVEIVLTEGGVWAAVRLGLVGVFVSPSSIWDSSFSGVLRPDVVGGGPGLITGFGSKAGFPADSCADTLGRI